MNQSKRIVGFLFYADIYPFDFEELRRNWSMILMRDSKDASWEIVDQGY